MVPHVLQSSHSVYLPTSSCSCKQSISSERPSNTLNNMYDHASNDPTLIRKMSSKPILQRENENSESFKGSAPVGNENQCLNPIAQFMQASYHDGSIAVCYAG